MFHSKEILDAYQRSLAFNPHDNKDVNALAIEDFNHIQKYFERYANVKGHSIGKTQAIRMLELIKQG